MSIFKNYRFGAFGRIGVKDESFAPTSWKTSLWEKFKNNDVFKPINIHDEENIREVRLFFNKKVFIIGINLFLLTFIYSFCKDIYFVSTSRYNLSTIQNKNFYNTIPSDLLFQYKWKKFQLESIKNIPDKKEKAKELQIQINIAENWMAASLASSRQSYFDNNYQNLKSNIIPLGNDLLVLFMISKYYWKRRKI
jgi:hypothetical protein